MTNMEIFNNAEFGRVRVIEEDGNYLFCAKDVAEALGYAVLALAQIVCKTLLPITHLP